MPRRPNHSLEDELVFLENSVAWFDDVRESGAAMVPPSFPDLGQRQKATANVGALDLRTGEIVESIDIVYAAPAENETVQRAYLIEAEFKREIKHGFVHVWKMCRLLKPSVRPELEVDWEIKKENIMVECIIWGPYATSIRGRRYTHQQSREALNDIAAQQFVAQQIGLDANIRHFLDVLEDGMQWWVFTSMVASEDLFSLAYRSIFTDSTARFWFRQVLNVSMVRFACTICRVLLNQSLFSVKAVVKLHKAGVCHRNLGLESVLLQDGKDVAILSDFEFSCRIPYAKNRSEDSMRRLILCDTICGRPLYIAPEIWKEEQAFDGFEVDIWALGTMLYIMLVGSDPWNIARQDDPRYTYLIIKGKLEESLIDRKLNPLAIDLLKRIFQEDPRNRLILYELRHHPWVLNA